MDEMNLGQIAWKLNDEFTGKGRKPLNRRTGYERRHGGLCEVSEQQLHGQPTDLLRQSDRGICRPRRRHVWYYRNVNDSYKQ